MKINSNDFCGRFWGGIFSKFEKKFYDDAVVMQRWETLKDEDLEPNCYETPMYYGGGKYVSYVVNVPKPPRSVCTGTILLMRMSKNRYRAAMDNGKAVEIQTFTTIKELEGYCEIFFA